MFFRSVSVNQIVLTEADLNECLHFQTFSFKSRAAHSQGIHGKSMKNRRFVNTVLKLTEELTEMALQMILSVNLWSGHELPLLTLEVQLN